MKILLLLLYWFMGFVMTLGACCTLGMIINTLVALLRSISRPKNLGLALGYSVAAGVGLLFLWGCLFLTGWIGDRTNYSSQTALLIGAAFPGIFALSAIPQFVGIALKQTAGIRIE
jgi:hypothetical protein